MVVVRLAEATWRWLAYQCAARCLRLYAAARLFLAAFETSLGIWRMPTSTPDPRMANAVGLPAAAHSYLARIDRSAPLIASIKEHLSMRVTCIVAALMLVFAGSLAPETSVAQSGPSHVNGWWLLGANMPWLNWANDFGGGLDQAQTDAKLAQAQQAGMHVVRWWVFEGGAQHIQHDAAGNPTGIDPQVYTDLDAAAAIAAKHSIGLNLTLFAGPGDAQQYFAASNTVHQELANVLAPVFKRYSGNPGVYAWEAVNEPDFNQGSATLPQIQDQVGRIDAAVHANSSTLVDVDTTLGADSSEWTGLGADFYTPHFYTNWCPSNVNCFSNVSAASLGLDKPVVIGETNDDAWQTYYDEGYAGTWCWSLSPEHTSDQIPCDLNGAAAFTSGKTDIGPQFSSGGSTPTATPTSPPSFPTPTPTVTSTPLPPTGTATATSSVPTAQSTPTPTPVPASIAWKLNESARPSTISLGQSTILRARAIASQNTQAILDVEVYDARFNKFYQTYRTLSFSANTAQSFSVSWTPPAVGSYHVMAGVFSTDWSHNYVFDNPGASLTVK
jgi:hypothetical protein